MVQWLRLHALTAGAWVRFLVRELRFSMADSDVQVEKSICKNCQNNFDKRPRRGCAQLDFKPHSTAVVVKQFLQWEQTGQRKK